MAGRGGGAAECLGLCSFCLAGGFHLRKFSDGDGCARRKGGCGARGGEQEGARGSKRCAKRRQDARADMGRAPRVGE